MLLKIPLVWTSCGGGCGSAFAFAACITAASLKPSAISGAGGKAVPLTQLAQGEDSLRIVTPSGKLGYVQVDLVLPLISDQICYRKEGNAWRIAGAIGGVPPGR